MIGDEVVLAIIAVLLGTSVAQGYFESLNTFEKVVATVGSGASLSIVLILIWERVSKSGREKRKRTEVVSEIPTILLTSSDQSVRMGLEADLGVPIYLPDTVRSRHVHILGATGSGKTESVVLNFLKQDVQRGLGAIILDAKGDSSFLNCLRSSVPEGRLRIFDLGDTNSLSYDPLEAGSALEGAQRLFASLTWSEEYYKSKAISTLQRLFQGHWERFGRNPRLTDLSVYLETPESYSAVAGSPDYPRKLAEKDFSDLSGLRDQIRSLCIGHLGRTLSPDSASEMHLADASKGVVLYFRLQSLLSSQLVTILGRLVINHLNYLAGLAHRSVDDLSEAPLIPTYLDEFASFACPEFADLISKARSAKIALHFSHQSIGDLTEVSPGFMNRITDNSATKIILRINDPDSAEFLARTFGTRLYQKITQRITNVKEIDLAETVGEGTQREAHRFRAAPDLFKTLPTGVGSVLIAHGLETPHGASTVLKIRFPKL